MQDQHKQELLKIMTKLDTMKQEKKSFQISNDIAWKVRDFLIMKINQADPSNNSLEALMKLNAPELVKRYFLKLFQIKNESSVRFAKCYR